MTREEAIERLKQNKAAAEFYAGMVQNTDAIENELKDIEAMKMAIEALSAEPCDQDAISREGLLKSWEELSPRGRTEFDQVIMTIPALPSAEAETVDCTEFIRWLTETVMDDGMWELNAVAYGEVIARKLTKLGVLEVKDDVYVYEPSAEADWIPCSERLPKAEYGESDCVLATCCWKSDTTTRWIEKLYFDGGNWCHPTGECFTHKVIAWKPLPEPYREDGEA